MIYDRRLLVRLLSYIKMKKNSEIEENLYETVN